MKLRREVVLLLLFYFSFFSTAGAQGLKGVEVDEHAMHRKMLKESKTGDVQRVDITLLDEQLITQDGDEVKFASEVIGDKLVVMTFIYTACSTICPVYSSIFSNLQNLLGDRIGKDVILVTVTLDPTTDVPQRMKMEADKFHAKPGWFYLTGNKPVVDRVLKGLDAYFPDFTLHPPMAIVGDGKTGIWKRINGFPKPEKLLSMVDDLKAAREETPFEKDNTEDSKAENKISPDDKAKNYFPDLPLIDQNKKNVKFYTDVIKDKIVLITFYYTDCPEACPLIIKKLRSVEALIPDQVGKNIFFVGLSVDAENDTPEAIKLFFEENKVSVDKGWTFLTGKKNNLDQIIKKLGQFTEFRESHSTLFLLGNVRTGHWMKVMSHYPAPAIVEKINILISEG